MKGERKKERDGKRKRKRERIVKGHGRKCSEKNYRGDVILTGGS